MSLNATKKNKKVEGTTYEKSRAHVIVKDGNIEKALNILKRKVKDSSLMKELRDRMEYKKSSAIKRQELLSAKLRQQKERGLTIE